MHPESKKFTSLGESLHITGRLIRERLMEVLSDLGYDYPIEFWPTLKFIWFNPQTPQHVIAEYLRRDKGTIARLLSRLEEEGLIDRVTSETNRRQNLVTLTSKGKAAYEKILASAIQLKQKSETGITQAELASCQSVLQRIYNNLY